VDFHAGDMPDFRRRREHHVTASRANLRGWKSRVPARE
jgi:hypothetical protein